MAKDLLFDISGVDLTQVAVSAEEVGAMNPQCGDMRQLDHVIWISDTKEQALGVQAIPMDVWWGPLHIPGRPLMPGVLMIEAAAQLSSIHYHKRTENDNFVGFTRLDDTVFRGQVLPGDTLYLLSHEISFKRRRFITLTQGMVNDKVVFEAKITGMVV